ncbi:MAG: MerR family transcriptional regulator, partial [Propionibacteriales bacterium]|nr:MerR family transcriptional regulator [Propionibacteriales bacterium]
LRTVADLTAAGIGIEGVRRILELDSEVASLRHRVAELEAELLIAGRAAIPNLPVVRSATTITRWEPGQLRPY